MNINLLGMGSVNGMLKQMKLKGKMEQRLRGQGTEQKSEIDRMKDQADKTIKLSSIEGKMKSGKKLSGSELEYLKKNAPTLYEKAVRIQKEREQYKKKLQGCKTREDVERVRTQKVMELGEEAKAVSQSSMSKGQKTAALEEIQMRLANIIDEHASFVASDDYKRLPSEEDEEKKREKKVELDELVEKEHQSPESVKSDEETKKTEPSVGATEDGEVSTGGNTLAPEKVVENPVEIKMDLDPQRQRVISLYKKAQR